MKVKPGTVINNRYKILNKHNFGAMGKTYIAEDLQSARHVIIKLMIFTEMEDWKTFELFEREVKTLKNLNHSNIPKYIDNFEIHEDEDVYYFLVQDLIEGQNLYELIESGRRFSYEEVLSIFKSMLEILNYLHRLNPALIHRDIQPKNIILNPNNEIFLVDFGSVGQIAKNTMAAGNTFVGTIGYFPPEQMMGKVFPSSDLYSLAMCMVFLLTGKNPADLPMKSGKVDFESRVEVHSYFIEIINKMTDFNPDTRFRTTAEVLDLMIDLNHRQYLYKRNQYYNKKAEQLKESHNQIENKKKSINRSSSSINPWFSIFGLFISLALFCLQIFSSVIGYRLFGSGFSEFVFFILLMVFGISAFNLLYSRH